MINEFLQRKVTVREAEAANTVVNETWPEGRVFGCIHDEWKSLVAEMRAGDELWAFRSSEESWDRLMGKEGFAVVRNGVVISFIITRLN